MILSIIIPCFNEESTIEEIIKRVNNVALNIEKEIIVIDDNSTDKSFQILENLHKKKKDSFFI